ncbi:Uncharacterised protein [Salmonella enterica subsp. enterica]|nr:Uncharacterised protein [Salmonella enterica subsp. enterica] [Salmonella enterica subsp. enterica serovar Florida]
MHCIYGHDLAIWLSIKRDFLIEIIPVHITRKLY